MPAINLIISALLIGFFLLFFLPTDRILKSIFGASLGRADLPLFTLLIVIGGVVYSVGTGWLMYLIFSVFCLWVFIVGFVSSKKYLYLLSAAFLAICPLLLIIKLRQLAEFSASLSFFCLALGILKDMFYTKVVDDGEPDD